MLEEDEVVRRLRAAGCVAPGDEAEVLRAAVPGAAALAAAVARRERGEPLAWIVGSSRSCGHDVAVLPGVYAPRPHTDVLAERAAAALRPGGRAVDLCCGSGAVAVHLARSVPAATVVAVDLDPLAVACARSNGLPALRADVSAVPLAAGSVDVVTAVPPYVPTAALRLLPADVQRFEPALALDGGADGLDVARAVVAAAARLLRPGGHLLVELGGEQDAALAPTLDAHGFADLDPWLDAEGDLRGIAARAGQPPGQRRARKSVTARG